MLPIRNPGGPTSSFPGDRLVLVLRSPYPQKTLIPRQIRRAGHLTGNCSSEGRDLVVGQRGPETATKARLLRMRP